ncbi:MAG TPA: hypothetical protein VH120_17600, partial [Gemmataceae bacterium]|nr:hypothetical protein [Gemmataceae bacterium]
MSNRSILTAVVFAIALIPTTATAQTATNTWIATASGNWSIAGNWDANGVPASASTTVVQFNGGSGAAYTATQDIAAGFLLNGLINNNTAGPTVTSATGDSLTFVANGGTGPFIYQNSSGSFTIGASGNAAYTIAGNLTLGGGGTGIIGLANPLIFQGSAITLAGFNTTSNGGGAALPSSAFTVNGNGVSSLNFSGILSGTPTSFTINTTAANYDTGAVFLSGANTFTASGGVILQSGNLSITNAAGLGNANNVLKISGGTLRVSATVPNPIVMNNTDLLYPGASTGTLTGPITVTGTAGLQVLGTGGLTLDNTAGFNGATTVGVPGITTSTMTIGSTASTTGSLLNTNGITVSTGSNSGTSGNLVLTNATASAQRLSASTPITLNSGRLTYISSATGVNAYSFGNLTVNGFGGISTQNAGTDTSPTALTINAL